MIIAIHNNKIIVNGFCACRNCPNFEPNAIIGYKGKCLLSGKKLQWYEGCYLLNGERTYGFATDKELMN